VFCLKPPSEAAIYCLWPVAPPHLEPVLCGGPYPVETWQASVRYGAEGLSTPFPNGITAS